MTHAPKTEPEAVSQLAKTIADFKVTDMLMQQTAVLRSMGVRIVVRPETLEALITLGEEGKQIAANVWVADRLSELVMTVDQYKHMRQRIDAGECRPDGSEWGRIVPLFRRLKNWRPHRDRQLSATS